MMIIVPPTPQRTSRLSPLYRVAAHFSYAGGVVLTLAATAVMLTSAGLAGMAGLTLTAGERLREQGLALYALGSPVTAAAFRARELFYARRRQGVDLD